MVIRSSLPKDTHRMYRQKGKGGFGEASFIMKLTELLKKQAFACLATLPNLRFGALGIRWHRHAIHYFVNDAILDSFLC